MKSHDEYKHEWNVCEQGVGTAIGELPPYFMARAARLSGTEPDDEDYQEFEEMLDQAEATQVTRY